MPTLPKVLINQADSKSAGGVALRVRTQACAPVAIGSYPNNFSAFRQCCRSYAYSAFLHRRFSFEIHWCKITLILIEWIAPAAGFLTQPDCRKSAASGCSAPGL